MKRLFSFLKILLCIALVPLLPFAGVAGLLLLVFAWFPTMLFLHVYEGIFGETPWTRRMFDALELDD